MAYSKEEVAAFAAKDRRISKLAILRDLITKMDLEEVRNVEPITELADKYVDYVYGVVSNDVVTPSNEIDWEAEAKALSITIPKRDEVKILYQILDKYKCEKGVELNVANLLKTIISTFGRYPTKQSGIDKVINLFN